MTRTLPQQLKALRTVGARHADMDGRPLLTTSVLIHVGMIKTGSTWLQEHLFGAPDTPFWSPSADGIPPKQRVKTHLRPLIEDAKGRLLPDEDFDPQPLRSELEPFRVPEGRCAVFSNERLAGHPLSNGIDRRQIATRIRRVFPNARILLVIREQRSAIASHYMQHLQYGGGYGLNNYIDGEWDHKCPSLTYHYFKYDRLIQLYYSQFGADNVLVLPFELFNVAPEEFVWRVCRFAGVELPPGLPFSVRANERKNHFSFLFFRRLVPLIRSSRGNAYSPALFGRTVGRGVHITLVNALGKFVPVSLDKWSKDRLSRRVEEITGDTYAASNREAERLTGLDLGSLGYIT